MKQLVKSTNPIVTLLLAATIFLTMGGCQAVKASIADSKQLVEVKPGTLMVSVEADGNVALPKQRKLYFETPGTIANVAVGKGDSVKKGQLIATLENSDQRLAVDIAMADVSLARNSFEKRVPCVVFLPGGYEYTDLPGVSDTLEVMRAELEKSIALLQSQNYDKAASELSLALDDANRAHRTLNESYIKSYTNGIDQATFIQYTLQLQKANLALEKAKQDLKKTELYAPFDGVIASVPVKEGDKISGANYASTFVAHLIDPTVIEVEGLLDEVDRPLVALGQEALVTVDALPGKEFKAKVTFVSDVANVKSGVVNYDFTLLIDQQPQAPLKEGMSATARVVREQLESVIVLPESLIKDLRSKPWVQIVQNDRVERRNVTLGRTDGKNWEITSGLEPGDKVTM